ncbi:MAG TPA: YggT family protein [Candidatus Eisenbacteria bacterium]|nr:YggT family protein [Candidatus Eisenbacteria bacterium]
MFVLGNLLEAVAAILDWGLAALALIVIVHALLSWVRPDPSNPIVRFIAVISDAVCDPIRRLIPTVIGGLDLAPLVALLVIQFVGRDFIVRTLRDLSFRLR